MAALIPSVKLVPAMQAATRSRGRILFESLEMPWKTLATSSTSCVARIIVGLRTGEWFNSSNWVFRSSRVFRSSMEPLHIPTRGLATEGIRCTAPAKLHPPKSEDSKLHAFSENTSWESKLPHGVDRAPWCGVASQLGNSIMTPSRAMCSALVISSSWWSNNCSTDRLCARSSKACSSMKWDTASARWLCPPPCRGRGRGATF
mmetsp:Transcript_40064/g.106289  ORF Transcript_40064/g.106289 Transcript_40064/m.106289 type:complete len:203 (-) Transcript_40064:239-847(-)